VTRALVPLSMTTIGLLPDRCRGCVAWELDADAVRSAVRLGDTEFEKEVWLSGVMLTWGSAGQIVTVDDRPVGFALFAPPTAVPGASAFPTSPVSPDAVLLTTARILPEFTGQGLARYLMNGVVSALTRRGVRAIELFGREEAPAGAGDERGATAVGDPVPSATAEESAPLAGGSLGDVAGSAGTSFAAARQGGSDPRIAEPDPAEANGLPRCLLPAAYARAVGFEVVAAHHRYPRLRFELGRDIGWKAEVESALEKLFTVIHVPASPSPPMPELVGQR
jgi:GNAT superfamily N-acetyltransferase